MNFQEMDDDTRLLFSQVEELLARLFGHSAEKARVMVREYYAKFTDPSYCVAIHVPTQDDDFFHHEGPLGMALRVHYYIDIRGDPQPEKYVEWRSAYQKSRKDRKAS